MTYSDDLKEEWAKEISKANLLLHESQFRIDMMNPGLSVKEMKQHKRAAESLIRRANRHTRKAVRIGRKIDRFNKNHTSGIEAVPNNEGEN